ncbi:MAG: aromatic ring-opening dioxygenase catalytic subunit (LigB family) [Pseudohongiellaceae bacterium]|jgi:aromatic ring-opening dioxygenase catalytic subunit (LigB family)
MSQLNTNSPHILYLPHGGGPMPLLGDPGHEKLISFLQSATRHIEKPDAIVVISAHWEEPQATLTAGAAPELIYDYGGFPPESYEIRYPASGHPLLAKEIAGRLEAQSIPVRLDLHRGFDHGMFVPLKLMYPEANIPCLQLSLMDNLDAGLHLALGKSLSSLLVDKNILVIGSGMSFHNIRSFFVPELVSQEDTVGFNAWLKETCTSNLLSDEEREQALINWQQAPGALKCHPRPEHLLPLHVCYGMAKDCGRRAEIVFDDEVMGREVIGLLW